MVGDETGGLVGTTGASTGALVVGEATGADGFFDQPSAEQAPWSQTEPTSSCEQHSSSCVHGSHCAVHPSRGPLGSQYFPHGPTQFSSDSQQNVPTGWWHVLKLIEQHPSPSPVGGVGVGLLTGVGRVGVGLLIGELVGVPLSDSNHTPEQKFSH